MEWIETSGRNFSRIVSAGVDISFLINPSISKEEFIQKLDSLYSFLAKNYGQEQILQSLPEMKKIIDNPDLKDNELAKLNIKMTELLISPMIEQLKELYNVMEKSEPSSEEEEDYEIMIGVIRNSIKGYNLLKEMLENEDIESGHKAMDILNSSQKRMTELIKKLKG